MKMTLKGLNAKLKADGYDAELVMGKGYYYFSGEQVKWCKTTMVGGVFRLNNLTYEQWVAELELLIKESEEKQFDMDATGDDDVIRIR